MHENDFPVRIGLAHVINKPVSLRLCHRIHVVRVNNSKMSVAVIERIVNSVDPVRVGLGVRVTKVKH